MVSPALSAVAIAIAVLSRQAGAAPPDCSAAELARLLEPPTARPAVALRCNATLGPTDVIEKHVVIRGAAASGIVLDCRGAVLRNDLLILSRETGKRDAAAGWERPERITVRNCVIEGQTRVSGMAINGEAPALRESSRTVGHTERAQNAAPRDILLENLTLRAREAIPLYVSPGVTRLTLRNSTITGRSRSAAIYLDAESAGNTLSGNTIDAELGREAIAVDASAHNLIKDNVIRPRSRRPGGIFLYRNCGEGGTVRHQAPHSNAIVGNEFHVAPAIWVASRNGNRRYCGADDGYPFGSSASNLDHAQNTVILGNHFFTNGSRDILRINDGPTLVLENRVVLPAASNAPPFARYVSVGAPQAPVLVQNDVGAGKRARAGLSCFEPGTLPALQVLASGETRPLAPDNARCTTRAVTCSDGELACAR